MKNSDYRILLTGAGGVIGRSLSEYLSRDFNVFATLRQDLDLLEAEAVEEYIAKHSINFIIHCATVGGRRSQNYDSNSSDIVEKNLRMFFNLARCLKSGMRMIHCGSGAEYAREHWREKMGEDFFDQYVPSDEYGYSKYIMSKYIEKSTQITCLRIFGLYSKYDDYRYKFISNAIAKNLLNFPIVISQNVKFDYLHADDFVKIVKWMIENEPKHKFYNVTPTESIDLVSIAEIINKHSQVKSEIVILNKGMNREYTGDNTRLLAELGKYPFEKYAVGIKLLMEEYYTRINDLDIDFLKEDPHIKACKVNLNAEK